MFLFNRGEFPNTLPFWLSRRITLASDSVTLRSGGNYEVAELILTLRSFCRLAATKVRTTLGLGIWVKISVRLRGILCFLHSRAFLG